MKNFKTSEHFKNFNNLKNLKKSQDFHKFQNYKYVKNLNNQKMVLLFWKSVYTAENIRRTEEFEQNSQASIQIVSAKKNCKNVWNSP